jgi:hypothetical protein
MGVSGIVVRLLEVFLVQGLRTEALTGFWEPSGWLGALTDPVLRTGLMDTETTAALGSVDALSAEVHRSTRTVRQGSEDSRGHHRGAFFASCASNARSGSSSGESRRSRVSPASSDMPTCPPSAAPSAARWAAPRRSTGAGSGVARSRGGHVTQPAARHPMTKNRHPSTRPVGMSRATPCPKVTPDSTPSPRRPRAAC